MYPTVETEFAKELVKELQQTRALAQKDVQDSQKKQKKYYDQRAKVKQLKVGDLVMFKTAPIFKLDRSYKGPFVVKSVIPTNTIIQPKGDDNAELINVSRQRLSKCDAEMEQSTP